jgi:hypothetical protein
MNDRRDFLKLAGTLAAVGTLGLPALSGVAATPSPRLASKRPPPSQRKFTSQAVERELARVKAKVGDPKLAWLFENGYPNTLDSTVHTGTLGLPALSGVAATPEPPNASKRPPT